MEINKLKTVLFVMLLNSGTIMIAQQMPETYFEQHYGKLAYGLFVPEDYNPSKSYPLVMFLHGWGNNYTVYSEFYSKAIQRSHPCFVFTPKTPVEWGDWSGWSWDGTTFTSLSEPTRTAMHLLDSLISCYSIDTNRLYVYGISMGGEGVFDLLHKMPNKFAAGISICGGGNAHWAGTIAMTPLWMFHGSDDEVNPPALTERVYNALCESGATKMRYTNYQGYGHAIWDKAQSEPSFYDWMFAFDKSQQEYAPPQGKINLSGTVSDQIQLQWNDMRSETNIRDKIWYYNIFNANGLLATVEYDVTGYSFAPSSNTDTFRIQAVNYHFEKSAFSNLLYWKDGKLYTSSPENAGEKSSDRGAPAWRAD